MKKLVITVHTEGASAAERGVVFRHLDKLGAMGGFAGKKHDARVDVLVDAITWSEGSVMQSSAPPKDLTITVEGPTGSGKTLVMAAIVEMLHERDIDISAIGQACYSEVCRLHGENIGRRVHDAKWARKPSVEAVQAVKVEVDAKDAMAAIDTVDAALATLSLPNDNLHQKVVDAANAVLLGLLKPQLDSAAMLVDLLDMANETLKWSHDVDAVNRAAAIKEKYKHG